MNANQPPAKTGSAQTQASIIYAGAMMVGGEVIVTNLPTSRRARPTRAITEVTARTAAIDRNHMCAPALEAMAAQSVCRE